MNNLYFSYNSMYNLYFSYSSGMIFFFSSLFFPLWNAHSGCAFELVIGQVRYLVYTKIFTKYVLYLHFYTQYIFTYMYQYFFLFTYIRMTTDKMPTDSNNIADNEQRSILQRFSGRFVNPIHNYYSVSNAFWLYDYLHQNIKEGSWKFGITSKQFSQKSQLERV